MHLLACSNSFLFLQPAEPEEKSGIHSLEFLMFAAAAIPPKLLKMDYFARSLFEFFNFLSQFQCDIVHRELAFPLQAV